MVTFIRTSAIIAIIGTIATSGVAKGVNTILDSAKNAANQANVSQLSLALELYYSDHNTYPIAQNGAQLIDILSYGNYIRNRPLDPSAFYYRPNSNGNDYILALNAKK